MRTSVVILLIFVLLISCKMDKEGSAVQIESFFNDELGIPAKLREKRTFYFINMDGCHDCLEANFYFLMNEPNLALTPIIVGNLAKGAFVDEASFLEKFRQALIINRQTMSKYTIYTLTPLLVQFDNEGKLSLSKNIEMDQLPELLSHTVAPQY